MEDTEKMHVILTWEMQRYLLQLIRLDADEDCSPEQCRLQVDCVKALTVHAQPIKK